LARRNQWQKRRHIILLKNPGLTPREVTYLQEMGRFVGPVTPPGGFFSRIDISNLTVKGKTR
jgi:hypothetical protein